LLAIFSLVFSPLTIGSKAFANAGSPSDDEQGPNNQKFVHVALQQLLLACILPFDAPLASKKTVHSWGNGIHLLDLRKTQECLERACVPYAMSLPKANRSCCRDERGP
jgi:hypothetical protein